MRVLMNRDMVFPVTQSMYDKTPGLIFLKAYEVGATYLATPFNVWLYKYINLHLNEEGVGTNKQKAELKLFLTDTKRIQLCLQSLFPSQYDMNLSNWKYISTDMKQYKVNKGKMHIKEQLVPFDEMLKLFQKNINTPMYF